MTVLSSTKKKYCLALPIVQFINPVCVHLSRIHGRRIGRSQCH